MDDDEQRFAVCLAYLKASYLKIYGSNPKAAEADAAFLALYAKVLSARDERR